MNPAMRFKVVVLPDPDGPRKVRNSPRLICRSIWSSATASPYAFDIPSMPRIVSSLI